MGTTWNESRSEALMGGAILVVEDEPAIQELIAVNLEHAGHQVLRAANVPEAEALVREVLPDLVLLDWMLPGPPGVNFARQLRDEVWGDHVFVEERTVDVHIRRLRQALEPTEHDSLVETVRGTGYRFRRALA